MVIQFEFFLIKRQNGECNVRLEILDGFFLIRVLIYQHLKSAFLEVTLNFEWE